MSLVITSPTEMKELNRRYRGANKTTDVLSFPNDSERAINPDAKSESLFLGEIIIDINYVYAQTETGNPQSDLQKVFIHGLLHLAGYDHLNSLQKKEMQELETRIIQFTRQEGQRG